MALAKIETELDLLVADQVFEAIHRAIMDGSFPAGHRLLIRNLAAELGTSVMPVREAIGRLEEAGLAEKVPYKGAVVKGLSTDELVHVYDARLLLEVEAVRRGVLHAFESDLDLMRQQHELMRQAVAEESAADFLDHDERLLSILYGAAGNPVILEMIRTLWQRCRPYKIVGVQNHLNSEDPSILLTYQKRLLVAAAANDADAAARIHKESIMTATARIRQILPSPAALL